MLIQPLDPRNAEQMARLNDIQQAAYRVEAEWIGSQAIPALRETPETLGRSTDAWLGAWQGERLCAGIALAVQDGMVEIAKLVVDPACSRQGLGKGLVGHALRAYPGCAFKVATGARNLPAKGLFRQLGFVPFASRTTPEGIEIELFVLRR